MPMNFGNLHEIQKVVKNNNNEVVAYSLEDGEIVMKEEAIAMVYQGRISGVTVYKDEFGEEFIIPLNDNKSLF